MPEACLKRKKAKSKVDYWTHDMVRLVEFAFSNIATTDYSIMFRAR
jgi:hypothetical protein